MAKTKKPTGLSISRNDKQFTFSWKAADNNHNDGQKFQWVNGIKNGKTWWRNVTIAAGKRSIKRSIDLKDYYPYSGKKTAKYISFHVRGDQRKNGKKHPNKTMSDWSDEKKFNLSAPKKPSVSTELIARNQTRLTWSTDVSTNNGQIFTNVQVQTVAVTNNNTDGKDLTGWTDWGGPFVASYSKVMEESISSIYQTNNATLTRWFRARSRGPGGASDWVYAKHVYGLPNKAGLIEVNGIKDGTATNTIQVYVKWQADIKKNTRPIDYTTVQYCLVSPASGFAVPEGTSWTDGPTVMDTVDDEGTDTNSTSFVIDAPLVDDKCLFVRVNSVHDSETKYSDYMLADGLTYTLTKPTITSITPDPTTFRIAISASNSSASNVADSKLAVIFRTEDPEDDKVIAVLTGASPSTTIQCPNWSEESIYKLGIFAFADTEAVTYTTHEEDYMINTPQPTSSTWNSGNGWYIRSGTSPDYIYTEQTGTTRNSSNTYYHKLIYNIYDIPSKPKMKSQEEWESGDIPRAPENVVLSSPSEGTIQVTWDWAWNSANISELSWADHDDAWESTNEPTTYQVKNIHTARWNISGLETGIEWFIRVRLIKSYGETELIGPWSGIASYKLTSAPDIPSLSFSKYVIAEGETFTARWNYVSNDGTDQKMAQICTATVNGTTGDVTYGNNILDLESTESEYLFDPKDLGWTVGNSYYLCVRVQSESERLSEWSEPVKIDIAVPLTAEITSSSLVKRDSLYSKTADTAVVTGKTYYTISASSVASPTAENLGSYYEKNGTTYSVTGDADVVSGKTYYTVTATSVNSPSTSYINSYYEEFSSVYYLTAMPLTIIVTGAGTNAYTNLVIFRDEDYHADRPDESTYDGFEGETVAYYTQQGQDQITINSDDLIGILDDTSSYRIVATVFDDLGQTAVVERPFIVAWAHQAIVPEAEVEVDNSNYIVKITPKLPSSLPQGWSLNNGDVCDIYRLSADKPELIVENGSFNTTYVDPYPAIGEYGGHRVVFKTVNGDYITVDGTYAWTDLDVEDGDIFNTDRSIIDFSGEQIEFLYNINISNSWKKDFTETKYLGGSVQGDWNPAVSRTGSINTVSVITDDKETIKQFRKLAAYPGICHIRTRDGSSFAADIQLNEDMQYTTFDLASYSLSITRVDSESLDGMTLADWNAMHNEE